MFKKSELDKIRKVAIKAAQAAGEVHMKYYRKRLVVREKARSSLVTEVDVRCEALIKKILEKEFPGFQFRGEESGEAAGRASDAPMWHVDPLDGTTNFVHGFPMFCASVGLAMGETPIVGVIHIATLGETFHGAKGQGAHLNRQALHVSTHRKLSESLLTTGFATLHDAKALCPEILKFQRAHMEARAVRRPGAAAIDLAYVAAGIFDSFWEKNLSSWDICAGALLVNEAGGKVTDYRGGKFRLNDNEILASNGLVHNAMMKLLK